jgi:hypothetical protein
MINKNISFLGHKDASWYGTPENQKALSYKIQLTPKKVNNIMRKAKDTDEGMVSVCNELSHEYNQVNKAFRSMGVITQHYMHIVKTRSEEITKMNPKGSRVPIVGIIAQWGSEIFGTFRQKIQKQVVNIAEDFDNIVAKHFEQSMNSMVDDYVKINTYVKEGIEFVEMRQGKSTVTEQLLQKVNRHKESCTKNYEALSNGLDNLSKRLNDVFGNLIEKQESKQTKRLFFKTVRKLFTLGMG